MRKNTLFVIVLFSFVFAKAQFNEDAPWMKDLEKVSTQQKNGKQFNLFEAGGEYSIEEYPNNKKEILGYNCHKVIIRKKEQIEDDFPINPFFM